MNIEHEKAAQIEVKVGQKVRAKGTLLTTGTVVDKCRSLVKIRHDQLMVAGEFAETWGPVSDWEVVS